MTICPVSPGCGAFSAEAGKAPGSGVSASCPILGPPACGPCIALCPEAAPPATQTLKLRGWGPWSPPAVPGGCARHHVSLMSHLRVRPLASAGPRVSPLSGGVETSPCLGAVEEGLAHTPGKEQPCRLHHLLVWGGLATGRWW